MVQDIDAEQAFDHFVAAFKTIQSRHEPPYDRFDADGIWYLKQIVMPMIEKQEPITIVLPGFPAKSPNDQDKVLGKLPDRAEEVGLERLEWFCQTVEESYPFGCRVILFSDGRVYADLIGIPHGDVMAFKAELQAMVQEAGYTHIQFDGLDRYVEANDGMKTLMTRFGVYDTDIDARLATDAGLRATYEAFSAFLQRDMAPCLQNLTKNQALERTRATAKQMIQRNVAYSKLVEAAYPDALRVSIHLYDNAGPKFGIHLIPGMTGVPKTPWHSVICEDLDGYMHCMELCDVDQKRYQVYSKRGRPWGFRETPALTP